jgi:hypothetical protein
LYDCMPSLDLLHRRWRPDAVYEASQRRREGRIQLISEQDPLLRCEGLNQYAAQVGGEVSLF